MTMIEDKLTPAQRIRLESVAQANIALGGSPSSWSETSRTLAVLRAAERIARYVESGVTTLPGGGNAA